MKTIMAEAESNKSTGSKAPTLLYHTSGLERIPQRERRKMQLPTPVDSFERSDNVTTESARTTSSPWKVIPPPAISPMTYPTPSLPPPSPAVPTPLGTPPAGLGRGKLPED